MEQSSVQSFYSREVSGQNTHPSPTKAEPLDGFTPVEIEAYLYPSGLRPWTPQHEYPSHNIAGLALGQGRVHIQGRVVSLYHHPVAAQPPRPNGFWRLVLKDDTSAVNVKLYYFKVTFDIRLDQLLAVWATHVAVNDPLGGACTNHYFFISISPERDTSVHIAAVAEPACSLFGRQPLDQVADQPLPGLMTLRDFALGGSELAGCKVLVLVASVGQRKRVTVRKGTEREHEADKVDVRVLDETHESTLTLWSAVSASAATWTPATTTLLLTNAYYRTSTSTGTGTAAGSISLAARTLIEVDPAFPEARWLQRYATQRAQRPCINPLCPPDLFDVPRLLAGPERVLYTLAAMDTAVRAAPGTAHAGYFSVVLFELGLTTLQRRGMLCASECCTVPLYANTTVATCKHCEATVELRPNPRLLTTLLDPTGRLAGASLLVAPAAWPALLGLAPAALCAEPPALLAQREARMLYMRVTLVMGWWPAEDSWERRAGETDAGAGPTAAAGEDADAAYARPAKGAGGRLVVLWAEG